jgi:hypothetical protein
MCQFEQGLFPADWSDKLDPLRQTLKIGREPEIDPDTVDVATVPLTRIAYVPVDRLSDEKLAAIYTRVRRYQLQRELLRVAQAISARPGYFDRVSNPKPIEVAGILVVEASSQRDWDRAEQTFEAGRASDPHRDRPENTVEWEMLHVRLRAVHTPPKDWVPELARVITTWSNDKRVSEVLLFGLVQMGLIRLVPNPDPNKGGYVADSRTLERLLDEYGPRITTSTGELGITATGPGIWTPESAKGGAGGGLWTPGSGAARPAASAPEPGGTKPKLIIPGR